MDMITHQAVSIYFIPADIFVGLKLFKEVLAVFIIFKYPLFIDTSEDNMVYPGATFLSRASWHVITLFNYNGKALLNQHRRTVPLCLLLIVG
jgi:hypothetical protein